jgi:hypothetical protein
LIYVHVKGKVSGGKGKENHRERRVRERTQSCWWIAWEFDGDADEIRGFFASLRMTNAKVEGRGFAGNL